MGATGATPTLAGPRPLEGGDCSPARREPPQRVSLDHDRPAGAPPGWGQPPGARRPTEETRALYVDHHDPPGDLPRAERGPPLRGDPRRRLPRRHHPVARLCRPDAPAPGAGVGGALRDGTRAAGPGRFRRVPVSLGQALRAPRRARLPPTPLAPLLPA